MPINKGLEEYNNKKQLGLIPEPKRLDPIEKAKQNPTSLRLAINAKCYDCSGFVKADVRSCDMQDCELFKVRSYQNDTVALKNAAIKKYSHSDKEILQERCNSDGNLLSPYAKLKANPKSLRASINAYCFGCTCGQYKEVKLCPDIFKFYSDKIKSCSDKAQLRSYKAELRKARNCPLHPVRPWKD